MRVHVLNCGTLEPPASGGRLKDVPWFVPGLLVSRCLLVESGARLLLIDAGLGLLDVAVPWHRLGPLFLAAWRPALRSAECAATQLEGLGYSRSDVTDVILTHLDPECAGGLADFPDAVVHVSDAELAATEHPLGLGARLRYRRAQWSHCVRWRRHREFGERWFGLPATPPLSGVNEEIRLVDLPGHSDGHVGVAVRTQSHWLLHAGDALRSHSQLELESAPAMSEPPWRVGDSDPPRQQGTLAQLKRLRRDRAEVRIVCSHDPRLPPLHDDAIPLTA